MLNKRACSKIVKTAAARYHPQFSSIVEDLGKVTTGRELNEAH